MRCLFLAWLVALLAPEFASARVISTDRSLDSANPGISFSDDGETVLFPEERGNSRRSRWTLFRNGKRSTPAWLKHKDGVAPYLTADGDHVVYTTARTVRNPYYRGTLSSPKYYVTDFSLHVRNLDTAREKKLQNFSSTDASANGRFVAAARIRPGTRGHQQAFDESDPGILDIRTGAFAKSSHRRKHAVFGISRDGSRALTYPLGAEGSRVRIGLLRASGRETALGKVSRDAFAGGNLFSEDGSLLLLPAARGSALYDVSTRTRTLIPRATSITADGSTISVKCDDGIYAYRIADKMWARVYRNPFARPAQGIQYAIRLSGDGSSILFIEATQRKYSLRLQPVSAPEFGSGKPFGC